RKCKARCAEIAGYSRSRDAHRAVICLQRGTGHGRGTACRHEEQAQEQRECRDRQVFWQKKPACPGTLSAPHDFSLLRSTCSCAPQDSRIIRLTGSSMCREMVLRPSMRLSSKVPARRPMSKKGCAIVV